LIDKLTIFSSRYGRLNITGTVLSKRKIRELVVNHHVRDYDDPRLYTLEALKRRGIPPGAILAFVNELGVTKAKTNIQTARLEQYVRRYLENTVPRLMLVLEPLKVVIEDLPEEWEEMIEVPFSKDPAFGVSRNVDTRTFSLLT
jgi:glutaminyl-tRNA synthetase